MISQRMVLGACGIRPMAVSLLLCHCKRLGVQLVRCLTELCLGPWSRSHIYQARGCKFDQAFFMFFLWGKIPPFTLIVRVSSLSSDYYDLPLPPRMSSASSFLTSGGILWAFPLETTGSLSFFSRTRRKLIIKSNARYHDWKGMETTLEAIAKQILYKTQIPGCVVLVHSNVLERVG
ncbi:hypothetical protein WG66_010695 [Moniliophthora roreri]|nr:hypothetical protein WG66_010695 [Moniliophthora roreri]